MRISPDKKRAAFIRDYNLWVRDVATGKETQLTKDGVKDFGYATDNAGWTHSDRPIVRWSPDSKKIATFQQDQRGVGEMYLVETRVGHPELQAWKYPLPGDPVVTTIQRVIIDVDDPHVVRLQMPPDQHRSTLCDDVACRGGEWEDVQWSADHAQVAFVSTSRDHKREQLRIADAATGEVRDVLEETVPTFFESGNGRVNWRYLPASNEIIWFSERDNWGQLYLYDLATGKLKNQITTGEGNVTQLLSVDEKNRMLYFLGVGREKGRDPYFIHFYRDRLRRKESRAADAGGCESRDDAVAFRTLFRRQLFEARCAAGHRAARRGRQADRARSRRPTSRDLLATGWKPPLPITVKARDGVTDLYGLMFKPTNFDPCEEVSDRQSYLSGSANRQRGQPQFFGGARRCQALAELGFIVVEIDGMGTPWRSKKFHEAYFGDMGDNTLPDQVAGMKQLARAISVDRYRSRGNLRPLRRRLRDGRRDVPLSGFLQGRDFRSRQSRQSRV